MIHLPALYNHLDAMQWRYATKSFDPKGRLDKELIYALEEVLRLTPTTMGMQLWRFIVISDPDLRTQMAQICSQTTGEVEEHAMQSASHVLVFCRPEKFETALIDQHLEHVAYVQNVSINDLFTYAEQLNQWSQKPEPELQAWMDGQVYLALGCLVSACAAARIDTSIAEGFDTKAMDQLLGLNEKKLQSVLACSIGFRSATDTSAKRKKVRYPIEDLFFPRPL